MLRTTAGATRATTGTMTRTRATRITRRGIHPPTRPVSLLVRAVDAEDDEPVPVPADGDGELGPVQEGVVVRLPADGGGRGGLQPGREREDGGVAHAHAEGGGGGGGVERSHV